MALLFILLRALSPPAGDIYIWWALRNIFVTNKDVPHSSRGKYACQMDEQPDEAV